MTPQDTRPEDTTLEQLALDKLTRVLGAPEGRRLFHKTLAKSGLTAIRTADDLYLFGDQLSRESGFASAVGRLLTVAAVLRGSSGRSRS
jgi:hypothetical protein